MSGREGVNVVEVKVNGSWGGVCDDGFGINEANVICRQLGYELGAEQVREKNIGENSLYFAVPVLEIVSPNSIMILQIDNISFL